MSLRWRTSQCDERANSHEEWPMTKALILATMSVGIPRITAESAKTFTVRLYAWMRIHGPILSRATERGIEPVPIRLTDVQLRIGLQTNASRLTGTEFKSQLIRDVMLDAAAQLAREAATVPERNTP